MSRLSSCSSMFDHKLNSQFRKNISSTTSTNVKERIKKQYIPKYRLKLNMDRKKIMSPSEDRLSELTTVQIDRLIEMEKIKSLLNSKKNGIKPVYFQYQQGDPHQHPNVFQPNFIAKINRIALERNIKHARSEQFEENKLTLSQKKQKYKQMGKKNLRFVKQYRVDEKKVGKEKEQTEDVKSVPSIEQSISQFQRTLEVKKRNRKMARDLKITRYKYQKSNILSSTRWFNGMSTYYLDKTQAKNQTNMHTISQTTKINTMGQPTKQQDFSTKCARKERMRNSYA